MQHILFVLELQNAAVMEDVSKEHVIVKRDGVAMIVLFQVIINALFCFVLLYLLVFNRLKLAPNQYYC